MGLLTGAQYRYFASTIYIAQIIIVFFIFLCELRSFYRATRKQDIKPVGSSSPRSDPNVPTTPTSLTPTASITPTTPTTPTVKQKEPAKWRFILPIFCYCLYILTGTCGVLTVLGVHPCGVYAMIGPSLYITAKMFMYLIFVYRLHAVYTQSAFEYSTRVLWVLFVVIILITILNIVLNLFTLHLHVTYDENGNKTCFVTAAIYIYGITIIFDLIISTLCCYLFIKPLLHLNKNNKAGSQHLRMVLIKMLVLTFVAVFTTFLFIGGMGVTRLMALIGIDTSINAICIMFFNKAYDHYFRIICCAPITICNNICDKHQDFHQSMSLITVNTRAIHIAQTTSI
eukprot:171848_1